ncbi:hypothetical protein HF313_19365 [Massilia atriviolacea]|uniref:Uncharacterized protein n=1 Tax=Massilia atriviolacea TaxID=2495579 RepID=A0A430HSQ1_9BURK|nr:hypothetical protein [Massilia atriviolacea]RSZ60575.1 hypothetical protein EJB06_00020 [Massilia atriviolacea]
MKFSCFTLMAMLVPVMPFAIADTYRRTLPGEIVVTVVDRPFSVSEHHVRGCVNARMCFVDNVPALGTTSLPTDEIESISVSVEGMTYRLQASGMFNARVALRNGGISRISGFCYDRRNCEFRGRFGNGGRSYFAEWVVKNGTATRTVLSPSMDVGWLFDDNPSPPKYE